MPDPLLLPSLAFLSGGGLLVARNYFERRFESPEDRYMALYGGEAWEASNMDLTLACDPALDEGWKAAFRSRLSLLLAAGGDASRLFRERAVWTAHGARGALSFEERPVRVEDLSGRRRGVSLDLASPGRIRVTWNHMQTDGVGMWNALRPLFDPNPPLVPYDGYRQPPAMLPELLALPSVARRLSWKGRLREAMPEHGLLCRGFSRWDAGEIRALKERCRAPFNLVSSALAVERVFARHPERERLNVGLTAYFPFLDGRNRYGVLLCRLRRGNTEALVRQLARKTRSALKSWGMTATQAYALNRMPDKAFTKAVDLYRRKIDVLVSSLPVGQLPTAIAGVDTAISCHPWELTIPYYFLLVGTRAELHVSWTSRFEEAPCFADWGAADPSVGLLAEAGGPALPAAPR